MSTPPSSPPWASPFQLRRQRVSRLMTALVIGAYALLSGVFTYRLIADFNPSRVSDLLFMLAGLTVNGMSFVWLRQRRYTRSAWSFMTANALVVVTYSIISSNNTALSGLVLALGLAIYAAATLPHRGVTPGIFFAFCSGGLTATLDYLRPWEHGHLNLTLADPTILILIALAIIFIVLLARLYPALPVNAKLLLASAGMSLFTTVGIFLPAYGVLRQTAPVWNAWASTFEATLVVAALISVLACSLGAQFTAHYIIRPLQTVAAASEKVAAEDWTGLNQITSAGNSYQAQLDDLAQQSQDEIADLARAFNHMAQRLQETQTGLRQNVHELKQVGAALPGHQPGHSTRLEKNAPGTRGDQCL
jgi:methyl-accepting chemotaxis protein